MPDVAELLSELDGLSERPPAAPRPVAEIRQRARRRRHRRLQRTGLAAGLVVVAVVGALVLRSDDGDGPDVDTGPVSPPSDPDAVPPTTVDDGVVRVLEGRGLTLDPADDLDDGDQVTLTLTTDPGGRLEVTQCAAEVVDYVGSLDPAAGAWCGSVFHLRDTAGATDMAFAVARRLETATGTVDCAEAAGRCVLVARPLLSSPSGGSADAQAGAAQARGDRLAAIGRYAPLLFRDGLPPLPAPEVRLSDVEGPVEDGQVVEIEARRFGRGTDLLVAQCTGPAEDLASAGETTIAERCDGVRFARLRTDGAGEVVADVQIFHDIGLFDPNGSARVPTWTPCTACSLVVRGGVAPENWVVPLDLAATDEPIRPVLRVSPSGPHAVGDEVRVEGSGFQIRTDVGVGLCAATVAPGEPPACSYSRTAFPTTDDQGAFVIDSYPLSALATAAARCGDGPGACVLHWQRDGVPVVADLPLDPSG
jgi:hypothetical protein